jgi:hypothetical protein
MMDGRVKTLHPKVFGGYSLPARQRAGGHAGAGRARDPHVRAGGGQPLPVRGHRWRGSNVSVPRRRSSRSTSAAPALVRAAAKNHAFVATVVTDPEQYSAVLRRDQPPTGGTSAPRLRRRAGRCGLRPHGFATTGPLPTISPASRIEGRLSPMLNLTLDLKRKARNCATVRIRTSRRRSMATPARRAQPGHRPPVARQGAFLQQPPRSGQRPGDRATAGAIRGPWSSSTTIPCGAADRRHPGRRRIAQGDGWRSAQRLRLRAGAEPPGRRRRRPRSSGSSRGSSSRRSWLPISRPRGARDPHHQARSGRSQRAACCDVGRLNSTPPPTAGSIAASTAGCVLHAGVGRSVPIPKATSGGWSPRRPCLEAQMLADVRFAWDHGPPREVERHRAWPRTACGAAAPAPAR